MLCSHKAGVEMGVRISIRDFSLSRLQNRKKKDQNKQTEQSPMGARLYAQQSKPANVIIDTQGWGTQPNLKNGWRRFQLS